MNLLNRKYSILQYEVVLAQLLCLGRNVQVRMLRLLSFITHSCWSFLLAIRSGLERACTQTDAVVVIQSMGGAGKKKNAEESSFNNISKKPRHRHSNCIYSVLSLVAWSY